MSVNLISVVVPIYNEVDSLRELCAKIQDVFRRENLPLELILVNDGSTDGSAEVIRELAQTYDNVVGAGFPRNRGKAAVLNEGFRLARGEYVVTIDADLQDDPEAIPPMLAYLQSAGLDIVSGWKQNRQDPFVKRVTSKIFNRAVRLLSGVKLHDINNGLKVYRAEVVKNIYIYGELHRFIPVLAKAQGFQSGEFRVRHFPRKFGKTKYGVSRFYKGFLDLVTVLFITKFMKRPMHFFGLSGLCLFLIGVIAEIYLLILKYGYGQPYKDHVALLIFGVLLIVFGMQFFSLGLISEMITYQDRKREE